MGGAKFIKTGFNIDLHRWQLFDYKALHNYLILYLKTYLGAIATLTWISSSCCSSRSGITGMSIKDKNTNSVM